MSISPVTSGAQRCWTAACLLAALFASSATAAHSAQTIADVHQQFQNPPDDTRPMMRWWWFGSAVVKPEIEREILAMKAGGIGGFEIQPVYPLALDDASTGFKNLPYLSEGFLGAVRFANDTAHSNGMRVDMTLASGWPYGGPHVPIDQASGRLRVAAVNVPAGATSVALPSLENGEALLAAFAGEGSAQHYIPEALHEINVDAHSGRTKLPDNVEASVVVFYINSRTGQQVKRPAVNAEGYVLDHLSLSAVQSHLQVVGEPLLQAFGDKPPYAVFSDSLEVYGADWTDDLLPEFRRRRGYDLKPLLPLLASGTSEQAKEVRHDWGLTLTELINERYLVTIDQWAKAHGTRFRSQTYGVPAVTLSSNNLVALPEGEGPQWDRFSFTRLATSASHLYGRPVTSAETWTWLHSPAFRATPLDMKAEADRFFIEGVNQFIGHGWPYTPPGAPEPGWAFYAAAVFNDHNPWYFAMPEVTKYLQRVSFLLRQGKPANDVAVLLPNDDGYAAFAPGQTNLSEEMQHYITPALVQAIEASGHNFDFIDAEAIARLGVSYPVLVLPHADRLSPETLKSLIAYVNKGGRVIAVGSKPSLAPAYADADRITTEVAQLSAELFHNGQRTASVPDDAALAGALQAAVEPELKLASGAAEIGFIHRRLPDADVYFLANTSNHAVSTTATFNATRHFASMWDPFTGEVTPSTASNLALSFAPYESRVVVFSDSGLSTQQGKPTGASTILLDLSRDWTVQFPGKPARAASAKASWTDDAEERFFSGTAVYTKKFSLRADQLAGSRTLTLDFGEGTPVEADPKIKSGMRALLESPVREVAEVKLNGKHVGVVWHPPYTLDVTSAMHAGENTVELKVANTAINLLAGRAPADYHLLNLRYGQRFVPQDMDNLQPLPSGLLGGVRLLGSK